MKLITLININWHFNFYIMHIKIKMPTIVGILIFMNMINTTSEHLKARKIVTFKQFRFYEHLKFNAQLC